METVREAPRRRMPIWARLLLSLVMTAIDAAIGGLVAATWSGALIGIGVALPVIVLGMLMPGVLAAVLFVLQAVSCAS
ncbi:hypothetical protein [Roseomonas fluvialis]|uniref:Uncharacterized protein n=1 Tax=Roseomonas fluvialis TaxID=1750527 RepID=A0ABN6P7T3_9PROT|nr:hypothetical protein [Roseomonas fluvialis]BDG74879.1 hypothetical protein Rmf_48080 [Roseomonas fluvialis]